MLIRKARPADLDGIYDVRQSVAENRLYETRDAFCALTGPTIAQGQCWVCEDEAGRLVGFGAIEAATGAIEAVYVRPEVEGRGIGRALVRKCCDGLLLKGHGFATLTTSAGTRAEGFYRKLGWRSFANTTPGEVLFRRSLLR
jgi:GNAT superfamily N-acetyltransferase